MNGWSATITASVWRVAFRPTLRFCAFGRNDGVDSVNGHETWIAHSDGLGRTIQVRQEAEANGFRVTDSIYDQRGNALFGSLPYFSSGTNFTKPTGTEMGSWHGYDPIGRPTAAAAGVNGTFSSGQLTGTSGTGGDSGSPLGTNTLAYFYSSDPWTLVLTDELGKAHRYSLDAYGRTNQIVEVTGGGNFTTTLSYNLAGDLTNITDHAGNQIQYACNGLGQVVAMADPDMGIWQYERDFAGRLRRQIDGNGQSVVFGYDDPLGRLRTKQVYAIFRVILPTGSPTSTTAATMRISRFMPGRFTRSLTARASKKMDTTCAGGRSLRRAIWPKTATPTRTSLRMTIWIGSRKAFTPTAAPWSPIYSTRAQTCRR